MLVRAGAISGSAVKITKPATMSQIHGPLEVGMITNGYVLEPAKKGFIPEKGII